MSELQAVREEETHRDAPVRHERSDISVSAVVRTGAVFTLVVATVLAGGAVMILWLQQADRAGQPTLTPAQQTELVPPEPRLQAQPQDDLARLRGREAVQLETYGWIDSGHQRARIPLDQAERLMVGRGLDDRP
ncbi:hypothetical protein [Marinivivus vitaminiproducens]|uniref:hypothetical protein n=1 Tax=Marinivivus vitaminiproducens TaxID=3035935 RepID=UPI00279B3B6E|nr:hypothetical protein P4R82_10610 [Geminicoccaceae bacterium SCSIO 64248]